jgi:hypothetical protein
MASTVFTGSDGTISIAVDSTPEGDKAKAVIDQFSLTPIGRCTGVQVRVTNEVRPFHELGQRFATELRSGNMNVYGSIERAYINGALLRLLLGDAADNRPQGAPVSPTFNLSVRLENPATPGTAATLTIAGVKIEEWTYGLPEDDYVMEKITFRGLWIKVEDATA